MDTVTIRDSHESAVTPETIKAIEEEFGFVLPKDYANFLLQHNGGRPEPEVFPIRGNQDDTSMVQYFYGINDGYYTSLKKYIEWRIGRMPNAFIPIATDPGGNMICTVVEGDNYGAIYFWDHEQEALAFGDEPPWLENLYFIAPTFDEFLGLLQELPEDSV